MNVEKQRNLQLLSDWMHVFGIEHTASKFIPTYSNNWQWCAKNDCLPENGGRKRLDQVMKSMNRVRNCLISTYNDKHDMTESEKINLRLKNFKRYAIRDVSVIKSVLS